MDSVVKVWGGDGNREQGVNEGEKGDFPKTCNYKDKFKNKQIKQENNRKLNNQSLLL